MNKTVERQDWLALPLYYVLALLFSWPLPLQAATAIMGDGKDGWLETWNFWWLNRALGSGQPPYTFSTQFAPGGVTSHLHILNPLQGFLTLPVQWLFGVPLAYNVACWSALALTAFGSYVLCRDVSESRIAGLLGGLIIGFAPHQMAQLLSHGSVASAQYFVLGIWCLWRAFQVAGRASWVWAAWSGACLVASWLTHFYLALFQGAAMLLLGLLFFGRKEAGGARWRPLALAGAAIMLGLGLAGPLLVAAAKDASSPDAAGQQEGTVEEIKSYSADLLAYLIPSPLHPLWGEPARAALRPLQGTLIEKVVFPGYLALALGLVGAISKRTRKAALPWVAIALAGLLLSLGPTLHIGGNDTGIQMPAAAFYALPLSSLLRVPARFTLLFGLGLGVCAALGMRALRDWAREPNRRLAPALAGGLLVLPVLPVLFELLPLPFPVTALKADPWYAQQAGNSGAVLEVPFDQYDTRPLAAQIVSGLPLVGGYLSRMPVYPPDRGVPPFAQFGLDRVPGSPLPPADEKGVCAPSVRPADYLDLLRLADVHYVVVHPGRMKQGDPRINFAAGLFPEGPVYTSGDTVAYEVTGKGPGAALLGAVEDARDWGEVEESSYRWTANTTARINVWSSLQRTVHLALALQSFGEDRHIGFAAGSNLIAESTVTQQLTQFALDWTAAGGFSSLRVSVSGRPHTPASLGLGADERPLTFKLAGCALSGK